MAKRDASGVDGRRGSDLDTMETLLRRQAVERLADVGGGADVETIDETMLFEYLNGQLDAAADERVRDAVVAHPDLAERLLDLQAFMHAAATKSAAGASEQAANDEAGDLDAAAVTWGTRMAWRDFAARHLEPRDPTPDSAERPRRPRRRDAWNPFRQDLPRQLVAALLLTAMGTGLGWWLGSPGGTALQPQQVRAVTLQVVRHGGAQRVPAHLPLMLQVPLSLSQGDCEQVELVLLHGQSEYLRLPVEPVDGQLHFVMPPLEVGTYRIDLVDCQGGRQGFPVDAQPMP